MKQFGLTMRLGAVVVIDGEVGVESFLLFVAVRVSELLLDDGVSETGRDNAAADFATIACANNAKWVTVDALIDRPSPENGCLPDVRAIQPHEHPGVSGSRWAHD